MTDIITRSGLRMPLPIVRIGLRILEVTALTLTVLGALLAVGLKNDNLATQLLSIYPRYSLAMNGFSVFQRMEERLPQKDESGKEAILNVGVVSIDEPQWSVFWDFVQSETAIRKSERNEPTPPQQLGVASPNPPQSSSPSSNQGEAVPEGSGVAKVPSTATPQSFAANQVNPAAIPINFQRIKTILAIRSPGVISAGTKPLVPPYALLVLWPGNLAHRVYEFLSFEEFRLDLRRMMLNELEEYSVWGTALSSIIALVAHILRSFASTA